MKLLNASSIPTSGTVFYEGKNIQDLTILDYRKTVLLVPQEVFLFDGTILDNFNTYRRYSQRTPLRATEAEKEKAKRDAGIVDVIPFDEMLDEYEEEIKSEKQ